MPSREEAVEKLQFQYRILAGAQRIDYLLSFNFFNDKCIGIRLEQ